MCLFLPPFHCELNPIKRCWCQAKNTVDLTVMDMASKDCPRGTGKMTHCFFITCIDYERAYKSGKTCHTVDTIVKQYKSHRRVN